MGASRERHGRAGRGFWLPRTFALWVFAFWAQTIACGGPSMAVQTEPADAILFVDGRRNPNAELLQFRYYGRVLLQVEPPIEERDGFRHIGVRRFVAVNEPVTPWIFPLDLAAELLLRGLGGTDDQSVALSLAENPIKVVVGLEPEGAGDLRARSARSRINR